MMSNDYPSDKIIDSVQMIVDSIKQRMKGRKSSLVVAIDGGSGAGKSVLSAKVADIIKATVIQCDDFFNIKIPDADWDTFSVEKKCRLCIDFERLSNEALLPLLAWKVARYYPFYYLSGNNSSIKEIVKEPSKVIMLDGIYSSYWLDHWVDLKVLVNVPSDVRYKRHNLREGTDDTDWHLRWDSVEDYYFSTLRPMDTFDLIVENE